MILLLMASVQSEAFSDRRLCVVLDTNVWRKELLLTTPLGEALEFALVRENDFLGLPEIVEREISKHILEVGQEATAKIRQGQDVLGRLTGHSGEPDPLGYFRLPWEAEFLEHEMKRAIEERLSSLDRLLVRVPFRPSHAIRSLDRVMDATPPNGPNNQQFKDSAIWEAILELGREYRVFFVTADKGFFRDRNPDRGLARNLVEECESLGLEVTIANDIETCLRAMGITGPPINVDAIGNAVDRVLRTILEGAAGRRDFALKPPPEVQVGRFPTADPDNLAIRYRLQFTLDDLLGTGARTGHLILTGEASLNIRANTIREIRIHDVRLSWEDDTGEQFFVGDVDVYDEVGAIANQVLPL